MLRLYCHLLLVQKHLCAIYLAMVCLFLPIQGNTETYTWKDESGRVHFGDSPPAKKTGIDAQQIEIKESNPPKVDAEVLKRRAKQYKLLEAYHEESNERKQEEEKKKQQEQKKQLSCKRAQNNYKNLERINRFYKTNEDGTRTYMNEEQRANYKQQLLDQIKTYCK